MSSKKDYSWLLFDADNTLFDFYAAEAESLYKSLDHLGLPKSSDHLQLYKRINKECWFAYEDGKLSKKALRTERFDRFFRAINTKANAEEFEQVYLGHLQNGTHLLPNTKEVLTSLQQQYNLGLITNGFKEVQRPRLEKSQLNQFFEVIVISDEIGTAKPEKAFFDHTFEQMNHSKPADVLVIGDSLNADIKGGQNYGTSTCWMNPEEAKSIPEIVPTYEIKTLVDLHTFL